VGPDSLAFAFSYYNRFDPIRLIELSSAIFISIPLEPCFLYILIFSQLLKKPNCFFYNLKLLTQHKVKNQEQQEEEKLIKESPLSITCEAGHDNGSVL